MDSYESSQKDSRDEITQYDVQLGEINTKLRYIQKKIDENCTNLTAFMTACKEDDGKIHERIDNIEDKLLDFVPRSAFDERLKLIVKNIPSNEELANAKFYSKAAIAGEFALLVLFVAAFITHLMAG